MCCSEWQRILSMVLFFNVAVFVFFPVYAFSFQPFAQPASAEILTKTSQRMQSCEPHCPSWTGFSNKTLSPRITLGLRPFHDKCWQLCCGGNFQSKGLGGDVRGDRTGPEISSSVKEVPGLYNCSRALHLQAPSLSSSSLLPPLFPLLHRPS